MNNAILFIALAFLTTVSCKDTKHISQTNSNSSQDNNTYVGTASVSQGLAKVVTQNIYECDRGRKAPIGTATALDGSTWTVPAQVHFTDDSFPFATDLNNPCTKIEYTSTDDALAALDGSDIIEVDADGEVITAFIFADNYFEMYINGIPVGKDNVPFTQFNSNIVRFKAQRPFTIAMKLVDWEENSGLGTESNRGNSFHAGDGGMVAVFKDSKETIIATTNSNWKAQTFYTAPLKDLTCATEEGNIRRSENCMTDTSESEDENTYYALHWKVPSGWQTESYNDNDWPSATEYTNETIGVDNKPSYTNFTDVFDNSSNDASFIWSTNVVLDNEVIVRYTVK